MGISLCANCRKVTVGFDMTVHAQCCMLAIIMSLHLLQAIIDTADTEESEQNTGYVLKRSMHL